MQITQELGKVADELTVFLRRPSYCYAMGQRTWTEEEQRQLKTFYPVGTHGEEINQDMWSCGLSIRLMFSAHRLYSKQVETRSLAFPLPELIRESSMFQKTREKSGLRICGSEAGLILV